MKKRQRFLQDRSSNLIAAPHSHDTVSELSLLLLQLIGDPPADMISDPPDRHRLRWDLPQSGQLSDDVLSYILIRAELFKQLKFRLIERAQLIRREHLNSLTFAREQIGKQLRSLSKCPERLKETSKKIVTRHVGFAHVHSC